MSSWEERESIRYRLNETIGNDETSPHFVPVTSNPFIELRTIVIQNSAFTTIQDALVEIANDLDDTSGERFQYWFHFVLGERAYLVFRRTTFPGLKPNDSNRY